ncbi:hypothetical protein O6H91_01G107800 [Diphasiastrum complanatum]|uniref:Uncharacterized protein n=1 Tax=Diphasiastrum complanatum TaxID=34168 RepID=A0ACC2EUI7_DIPCM|nr:hypothetical protein O6H91_01G107800 [Diphasiastrum complanatum]
MVGFACRPPFSLSTRRGLKSRDETKHRESHHKKQISSEKVSVFKEFEKNFSDCNAFLSKVHDWLYEKLEGEVEGKLQFEKPFQLEELRQLDLAIEGRSFQQLFRMPYLQAGTSGAMETEIYVAVEDFMHASAEGLWEIFWATDDHMPFFVIGPCPSWSTSQSRNGPVLGPALVKRNGRNGGFGWDNVLEFVEIGLEDEGSSQPGQLVPFTTIIGRTLFRGIHMLWSRFYSDNKSGIRRNVDTAYILFINSSHGGVVKLKGNISKLESRKNLCYANAADWIQNHAEIHVSNVEQVWNRFGNANWGDIGALQLLLATFKCIEQCKGAPKKSISEMASDHSVRLYRRRIERKMFEVPENEHRVSLQNHKEIVEYEEIESHEIVNESENMKLEPGTVLWLEDAHRQRGFQIHSGIGDGKQSIYIGMSLDEIGNSLLIHIGAHPSQLEPSWEDMSTWYQVQRQTRILNIMKQRGLCCKYLPQIVASGRLLHPGPCIKTTPSGRCNHPWCGTPVLVTYPIGESLDVILENHGILSPEEVLQSCHDCLCALRCAGSVGIQHGDIRPEHVVRVKGTDGEHFYVLGDWGRAVLEDRDSPAIAPRYSSTYALQEGKLCPASDAENLVYMLFRLCGGTMPEFESMEEALQWRERAWSKRLIQQQLGEVSAILKAHADYVDSLIGTPYPVDYDIWLRRLTKTLHINDRGKRLDYMISPKKMDHGAESSGTSVTSQG